MTSVLALPLPEYEKMSMNGKSRAPCAPFEFVAVPKFAESAIPWMSSADPIDLRELEPDDDIDGINVQPRVRPITDFMSKPVNTKNKSFVLREAIMESQAQWMERERIGTAQVMEKFKGLNQLIRDKSLVLPLVDFEEYLKK
jgi:hypothetical protein